MTLTATVSTFGCAHADVRPRILVVEDDPQLGDFLRLGFEYEGCEVFAAATRGDVRTAIAQHTPDVLVVEQQLSGLSGVELLRSLRASGNDAVVILLMDGRGVDERVAALEAGADDVMSKPLAFKELMARVCAGLRRGKSRATQTQLAFEDILLDQRTRLVQRRGRTIELTPREFDLLAYFLRHPRQILPRDTIIESIWGRDYCGESNILDVYIHTLRVKLGDQPPRLLRTVRGMGYVLRAYEARSTRGEAAEREGISLAATTSRTAVWTNTRLPGIDPRGPQRQLHPRVLVAAS